MLSRRGLGRGCRLLLFFALLLLLFGTATNGEERKLQITYPAVGTGAEKCALTEKTNGELNGEKSGVKDECVFWVKHDEELPLPTYGGKKLTYQEELEAAVKKTKEECRTQVEKTKEDCGTPAAIIIFLIVLCILLLGETGFVVYYVFFRKRGGANGGEQDAGGSSENIGGAEA